MNGSIINYSFDEECLCFLDQRNLDKVQWLQDPNQSSVDNLNSVWCEDIRHFRNKKNKYLKVKINELVTNSKNSNIRDFNRSSMSLRRVTALELI
jgi:hypothetical protein